MNIPTRTFLRSVLILFILTAAFAVSAGAWNSVPVVNDPLVRMPGTQPGQVSLEAPNRCLNCHSGYDPAVEPGTNWQGSMMAQSARDFLFFACMTVAGQDSIWATGRPNAVDICERCHFPKGWLEGRSDPTNASAMTGADFDGVQCDHCHRMYDPFFATNYDGTREGSDWLLYWDETNASGTPSQAAADTTYAEDASLISAILNFNGTAFFTGLLPPGNYVENASGQYFVSPNAAKRASFADAAARHQMLYSRYHKSKYFCSTCHDVSNPVLANLGADPSLKLPTELNSAFSFLHVERTFSEFMLSAYGQQGGAPTNADFQAHGAPNITHAAKCQDCHMRDVNGVACNKQGVPVRPNESIEHPNSGVPLHDLTGGNAWVSAVLASAIPGSPNHDPVNDTLLNQGPAALTLDLNQGLGIDPVALLAGSERAKQQLLLAATIKNLNYSPATGLVTFRVQNNSGHKLISGFPEGRRMFVNIRAYDSGGGLVYEVNPYDESAGTLKGLSYAYQPGQGLPDPQPLSPAEVHEDDLVYEMHPASSLTGETETFHFALADGRYKDNRIPPKGFRISQADTRLTVPVRFGDEDPNLYSPEEYAGGFDDVSLAILPGAAYVEVNLYYQTTSREYIEFLRDEINGAGSPTLASPTPSGEAQAYIVQSDPFFSQMKGWGDTIWQLWAHNLNLDGAKPFLMASASTGTAPTCDLEAPSLDSANPGHTQVTLEWTPGPGTPDGYKVYYDQAGKSQLIADVGSDTTYTDPGLTDGVEYCYKVTAYGPTCESPFSNILCATPSNQGQQTEPAGATALETGLYSGKGNNQTFNPQTAFNAGDNVTIRVLVVDQTTNLPLAGATVDLLISGPEGTTLSTGSSDANGLAEATWGTKAPNKRNPGTSPGSYTVQTAGVSANGYHWDGVQTGTTFTLQ